MTYRSVEPVAEMKPALATTWPGLEGEVLRMGKRWWHPKEGENGGSIDPSIKQRSRTRNLKIFN
jgi:hypothetical protein